MNSRKFKKLVMKNRDVPPFLQLLRDAKPIADGPPEWFKNTRHPAPRGIREITKCGANHYCIWLEHGDYDSRKNQVLIQNNGSGQLWLVTCAIGNSIWIKM